MHRKYKIRNFFTEFTDLYFDLDVVLMLMNYYKAYIVCHQAPISGVLAISCAGPTCLSPLSRGISRNLSLCLSKFNCWGDRRLKGLYSARLLSVTWPCIGSDQTLKLIRQFTQKSREITWRWEIVHFLIIFSPFAE